MQLWLNHTARHAGALLRGQRHAHAWKTHGHLQHLVHRNSISKMHFCACVHAARALHHICNRSGADMRNIDFVCGAKFGPHEFVHLPVMPKEE
eukprot:1157346-Pelagomonas_calceolata.AAC.12